MPRETVDQPLRKAITTAAEALAKDLPPERATGNDAAMWWSIVKPRGRDWIQTPAWAAAAQALMADDLGRTHIGCDIPSSAGKLECDAEKFIGSVVIRALVHAGGTAITDDALTAALGDMWGYLESNELRAMITLPVFGLSWSGDETVELAGHTVIAPLPPSQAEACWASIDAEDQGKLPLRWRICHRTTLAKAPGAAAPPGDWATLSRVLRQSLLDASARAGYLAFPLAQLTLESWVPGNLGAGGWSWAPFDAPDQGRVNLATDETRESLIRAWRALASGNPPAR